MTVLPIAQREMRVAARKRSTFWIRLVAALLTLAIASLLLLMFSMGAGFMPNKGKILFTVLAWLAFIYALAAGVFLTSDCLSEEKREGTLGLLFLTDLRGYDVVLGKLAATSLHAFYALVAAFPIIALSLLLGGLLAEEFWKSILAIANMLFFSLAVGMLASCISREPLRAMNATLLLLSLLIGVPYLIDWLLPAWNTTRFVPRASLITPLHPFITVQTGWRQPFWLSLLLSHCIAWICLALAAWGVPQSWQERGIGHDRNTAQHNAARVRKEADRRSDDPILWLASRARRFRLWLLLAVLGVTIIVGVGGGSRGAAMFIAQSVLNVLSLLLYVWMAAHATRFFVDGVRNGALELILCTPLTPRCIVHAQWRSFVTTFALPVLSLITAEQLSAFTQFLQVNAGAAFFDTSVIANQINSAITSITTPAALAWFGMWMGVRSRKAHVAVIKTLVFVFVLPFIVAAILQIILTVTIGVRSRAPDWFAPAITCVLWVAKDAIFIAWSRRQLYTRFQETVAGIHTPATRLWPWEAIRWRPD